MAISVLGPAAPACPPPAPRMSQHSRSSSGLHRRHSASNNSNLKSSSPEYSYEIIELIGAGSYGEVFRVVRISDGMVLALKCFNKDQIRKSNAFPIIHAEKNALVELRTKPYIINFFRTIMDTEYIHILMEFCAIGDLTALIKTYGTLPVEWARFFIAELCLALEQVHLAGYFHRDVKPSNVLLGADGHIRLIDFGTAKRISNAVLNASKGRHPSLTGTAHYIAPEVVLQQSESPNVDFWAVGCILYYMLVGSAPFSGDGSNAVFDSIIKKEINLNFANEEEQLARNFIERCLERDPSRRIGATGFQEIRGHPFISALMQRKEKQVPPFSPFVVWVDVAKYKESRAQGFEWKTLIPRVTGQWRTHNPDSRPHTLSRNVIRTYMLFGEQPAFFSYLLKRRRLQPWRRRLLILTDMARLLLINPYCRSVKQTLRAAEIGNVELVSATEFHVVSQHKVFRFRDTPDNVALWIREFRRIVFCDTEDIHSVRMYNATATHSGFRRLPKFGSLATHSPLDSFTRFSLRPMPFSLPMTTAECDAIEAEYEEAVKPDAPGRPSRPPSVVRTLSGLTDSDEPILHNRPGFGTLELKEAASLFPRKAPRALGSQAPFFCSFPPTSSSRIMGTRYFAPSQPYFDVQKESLQGRPSYIMPPKQWAKAGASMNHVVEFAGKSWGPVLRVGGVVLHSNQARRPVASTPSLFLHKAARFPL
eukprot:gnl/Chilomastix_cuspidata/1320.p1 GENE.gnl/Chilomastix_cuspidata/1320~~gnl/Chilomastix_cuspidata/1320.p1  ORF type:complete len:706 (-),score=345.09 gnl/Chilomastix_cuspidata/1320:641-2758(-)